LNFDDKYLLTVSFRRDGSSVLIKIWANFPAAAFAWKIKEDLLPNSTSI
jgi:iron complex outermembrane receptor protein